MSGLIPNRQNAIILNVMLTTVDFNTSAHGIKDSNADLRQQRLCAQYKKQKIAEGLNVLTDAATTPIRVCCQDRSLDNTLQLQGCVLYGWSFMQRTQVTPGQRQIETLIAHILSTLI